MPLARVIVQQPALPKYRVPVFRELAKRPGMDLQFIYAQGRRITNQPPDGFNARMIPMRVLSLGSRELWWHSPQLAGATAKACDVLVLSWNVHYLSLIPALLRARASGVRTVLWGHGYSKREAPWRRWIRQRVARLGDALLFYNQSTAQTYLDAGWPSDRVFVALNAIDQQPIQNARSDWLGRPEDLATFARQRKLDRGPVLLFVSRLAPENRVDLLIEATARLRETYPGLQTVIIGKGEPEGQRLGALAASLGVQDHVQFPGPIYDEHELAPWFIHANIFCYPANIGLSILHAFGYGLPVVTSDRIESQNPEIEALRDGENGLLYHDGGAEPANALTSALQRILADSDLAQRLSREAHRTVTEQFSLRNMVDGMEAAIRGPDSKRGDSS